MILKVRSILALLLYISIILLVTSSSLSSLFGLPKLDTLMMPVYLFTCIFMIFVYPPDRSIRDSIIILLLLAIVSSLSLILNYTYDGLIDVLFISFLVYLFYISYLSIKMYSFDADFIRSLVSLPIILIYLGFFIELFLGVQLVQGNSSLSILDNAFKGFFFNTNDQAVVVTSLLGAVCFFFILNQKKRKYRYIGYIHIIISGFIVFISASRFALIIYLISVLSTFFLNSNRIFKILYTILAIILSTLILNLQFLKPIFNFLSQFPWLERSVERFELAIFSIEDDNSVGYRTEIYQSFLDNFHIVWIGHGPRNYYEYFSAKPLSYSLGYTNPHSFFIEVYLAFGIFAFIIFLIFLLNSIYSVFVNSNLKLTQRIFFLVIVFSFCSLIWVPSSILRLPLIWYPLFLIIIFSKNYRVNYV